MLDASRVRELPSQDARRYAALELDAAHEAAVEDFGDEWSQLDPYPRLQLASYGHLFGRFLLPAGFFAGKAVLDLGCGNGRLGKFLLPGAQSYLGVELSAALHHFRVPPEHAAKTALVRASIEDLPVLSASAQAVVCWGVLHHVRDWRAALAEMKRVVAPGGTLLVYVYPDAFAPRENLNRLLRHVDSDDFRQYCRWLLRSLRRCGEIDRVLMKEVSSALCVGVQLDTDWEVFQAFDGLGPAYHHLLEGELPGQFDAAWRITVTHRGCFRIVAPG